MSIVTSADIDPVSLGPDGRVLHGDLRSLAFDYGQDAAWWREVGWAFPNVDIAVAAAPREGAPSEFVFRFECTNYKQQAPLCVVWDAEANGPLPLSRRPFGRDQVGVVFRRDWEDGKYLYTPLDRYALQTHSDWPAKYRSAWKVTSELADYLNHLHGLLNSRSYTGLAGP
jgi:hypothetical protein